MLVKKKSKKSFLEALYSKKGKGRLLPLKIRGGMSAVGSTLRRWMWGTQSRLEQLIAPRNLQTHRKQLLPHVWTKSYLILSLKKSKPRFSPRMGIKIGVLRGYCGGYGPKWRVGPWACPRTLVSPRRQRDLDDLRYKPYHGRQRKKVRGGTSPRTLKIRSKCMFKPLKHTP